MKKNLYIINFYLRFWCWSEMIFLLNYILKIQYALQVGQLINIYLHLIHPLQQCSIPPFFKKNNQTKNWNLYQENRFLVECTTKVHHIICFTWMTADKCVCNTHIFLSSVCCIIHIIDYNNVHTQQRHENKHGRDGQMHLHVQGHM